MSATTAQPGTTIAQLVATTGKILTQAEAVAIYSAMCALNTVNATAKASLGNVATEGTNVFESADGVHVMWVRAYDVLGSEFYPTQSAFAAAYGVQL